jgi:hypothetical protein
LLRHVVDAVCDTAKKHRTNDQPQPDIIEHPLWLRHSLADFEQFPQNLTAPAAYHRH